MGLVLKQQIYNIILNAIIYCSELWSPEKVKTTKEVDIEGDWLSLCTPDVPQLNGRYCPSEKIFSSLDTLAAWGLSKERESEANYATNDFTNE